MGGYYSNYLLRRIFRLYLIIFIIVFKLVLLPFHEKVVFTIYWCSYSRKLHGSTKTRHWPQMLYRHLGIVSKFHF